MRKRGLSGIVTTILIILLVIVAVGIIWVAVNRTLSESSEEINVGSLSTRLSVSQDSVVFEETASNMVSFLVKRVGSEGEINGIYIVLEDENGLSKKYKQDYPSGLKEYETVKVSQSYADSGLGKITKISVVPVFKIGEEKELPGKLETHQKVSTPKKALRFDGVDDYLKVENENAPKPNTKVTIMGWVKIDNPDKSQNMRTIFSAIRNSGGVAANRYAFFFTFSFVEGFSNDELFTYLRTVVNFKGDYLGNVFYSLSDQLQNPSLNLYDWTHVAVTYDGANLIYYKDGAEFKKVGVTNGGILDYDLGLWIGAQPQYALGSYNFDNIRAFFNGVIDELRIYSGVLTAEEIATDYNNGEGTYGNPNEEKLLAGWHFDSIDSSGNPNVIYDFSGNDATAKVYGNPELVEGKV